jgi:tetratricopeptide (TPR) repeat protein
VNRQTKLVAALLIAALCVVAALVRLWSEPATVTRLEHQQQMQQSEVRQRFEQGVVMLHARQFDNAVTAFHRVLELAPRLPEAHVNMGYALIGLERLDAARGFFEAAVTVNPRQANAYYGLALVDEARGDLEAALGDMRTYLHFAPPGDDAYRAKARAAIWEWEDKLGRHAGGGSAAATAAAPASMPARP